MKNFFKNTLMTIGVLSVFLIDAYTQEVWTQKNNFPGTERSAPFTAVVNDFGYIGCGYHWINDYTEIEYLNDLWKYNSINDEWSLVTNFPGVGRTGQVSFVLGEDIYVGLGYYGINWISYYTNEFYKYNTQSNTWMPIAVFPLEISGAYCFVNNGVAYVGGGWDESGVMNSSLYRYNSDFNQWESVSDMSLYLSNAPLIKTAAYSFLDNVIISTGLDFYGEETKLTVKYDPILNQWDEMGVFPGSARDEATCFMIGEKAYLGFGGFFDEATSNGEAFQDLYSYNFLTNSWIQLSNIPPTIFMPSAFSIANKAYLLNYSEFWEFTPSTNVEGVVLIPENLFLFEGQANSLNYNITPSIAINQNVNWISTDPLVASIDSEGNVLGLSEGNTDIICLTQEGGYSDTCHVTVYNSVYECDTLWPESFSSDCEPSFTLYFSGNSQEEDCGYVSGNNCFYDKEKAQKYYIDGSALINSSVALFSIKSGENGVVRMKIYDVDNSGMPGNILGVTNFISVADIDTADIFNNLFYFEYPVLVQDSFFLSVEIPYQFNPNENLVAVITQSMECSSDEMLAFEMWEDNSWHSFYEVYSDNVDLGLCPVVCPIGHDYVCESVIEEYIIDFESDEDVFETWDIINLDNDIIYPDIEAGWDYYFDVDYAATDSGFVFCAANTDGITPLNDWTISKCMDLTEMHTYELSFYYMAGDNELEENLSVFLGDSPSLSNMTDLLVQLDSFNNIEYSIAIDTFSVSSSGVYYLGFYSHSDAGSSGIFMDHVVVRKISSEWGPSLIELNPQSIEIVAASSPIQIIATLTPNNVSNPNLIWSSTDNSVISVDQNGWINAHSPGVAYIIAHAEVGNAADSCLVTVIASGSGDWTALSGYPSIPRVFGMAYSIDEYGYMGAGYYYDGSYVYPQYLYRFNSNDNTWVEHCLLPTPQRQCPVYFAIDDILYYGMGANNGYKYDFWSYNVVSNDWGTKATFPGDGRNAQVSFAIGEKGYVVSGITASGVVADVWEYNSISDQWVQKSDFPGGARYGASSFVINGMAYVCLGWGGTFKNDLWRYDPVSNTWVQMSDFPGVLRNFASSFVIDDKAYICLGNTGTTAYLNDLWEYDPVSNSWRQLDNYLGTGRYGSVSFVIDDTAYVGTGYDGSYRYDFYKYTSCNISDYFISDDVNVCENSDVVFNVSGGQTESVSYQWKYNGIDILGQTNPSLSIENIDIENQGFYSCNIYNTCDNVQSEIAELTVNPVYSFTESHSICQGETYTWQGSDYTEANTYTASYLSVNGCDSIYTLNLTVNPVYAFTENHSICQGETYTWQGTDYTEANTYTASYLSVNGCDSIYTLNLTVNPVYEFIESATICDNESYFWQGENYGGVSDVIMINYTSQFGCDSTYILNLTVNPTYIFEEMLTICEGETFEWQGETYTAGGYLQYQKDYESVFGCDSIYILHMNINELPTVSITGLDAQYCDNITSVQLTGEPEGGVFNGPGVTGSVFNPSSVGQGIWDIMYTYSDANNCESFATQSVEVYDCSLIDNEITSSVLIYPNPNSGDFTISLKESGEYTLAIYNSLGQIVWSQNTNMSEQKEYSVSGLVPGTYILKLVSEANTDVLKIVIR